MNDNTDGLRLLLPWPDKVLNPNVEDHWAVKRDAKKYLRDATFLLTRNRGVSLDPQKRYKVILAFCPPDNRTRDLDNLLTSYKAGLDGMCRALGINDKMIKPVPDWGPVTPRGKVEVIISELVLDTEAEIL